VSQSALQIGQVVVGYRDAERLEAQLWAHPSIMPAGAGPAPN
jgi:hypothetical protein